MGRGLSVASELNTHTVSIALGSRRHTAPTHADIAYSTDQREAPPGWVGGYIQNNKTTLVHSARVRRSWLGTAASAAARPGTPYRGTHSLLDLLLVGVCSRTDATPHPTRGDCEGGGEHAPARWPDLHSFSHYRIRAAPHSLWQPAR